MSASENSGQFRASVNTLAGAIVDRLVAGADRYRVTVSRGSLGELLIDAGAKARGGIDAGLLLTEICMGGLGKVTLSHSPGAAKWPFWLTVSSNDPVVALEKNEIVSGRRQFGLVYEDRMILFSSKESYEKFVKESKRYTTELQQALQSSNAVRR